MPSSDVNGGQMAVGFSLRISAKVSWTASPDVKELRLASSRFPSPDVSEGLLAAGFPLQIPYQGRSASSRIPSPDVKEGQL
jgi:hypothetical protein